MTFSEPEQETDAALNPLEDELDADLTVQLQLPGVLVDCAPTKSV